MRLRKRPHEGNTLVLILVSFIGFVLAIAYLGINVAQILASRQEAQTAIDAAALQAAKDVSRIVVHGPLGTMALVDDAPDKSGWPVIGVNTILATIRLDALIADKLGNTSMQVLLKNDLSQTKAALALLLEKIKKSAEQGGGGAYDKQGNVVDIRQNAYDAYLENQQRLTNSKEPPKTFKILVGYLTDKATGVRQTPIPVPNPETLDSISFNSSNSYTVNNKKYYVSGFSYPVAGLTDTVRFSSIGKEIALVNNSDFVQSDSEVPAAVQAIVEQAIVQAAQPMVQDEAERKKLKIQYMENVATAQLGTNQSLQSRAPGVLELHFTGGIPADGPGGVPSFRSVARIMNSSQLTPATGDLKSPYSGWEHIDPNTGQVVGEGIWFNAKGGDVPGPGSVGPRAFKDISGRETDDPSVSLSFLVYDWLRSLNYRPNAQAVIDALKTDFSNLSASNGSRTIFAGNDTMFAPAYAAAGPDGLTTGMFTVFPGTNDSTLGGSGLMVNGQFVGGYDPRSLSKYNNDPAAYQRQQARMWGYVPADAVMPPTTAVVKLTPNYYGWYGYMVETVDGNNFWTNMQPYLDQYKATNTCAAVIYQAVTVILQDTFKGDKELQDLMGKLSPTQQSALNDSEKSQTYANLGESGLADQFQNGASGLSGVDPSLITRIELRKQALTSKVFREKPKVLAALINATSAIETTQAMHLNMKALTGVGVKCITLSNQFKIAGGDFYPTMYPFNAPTLTAYTAFYVSHAYQSINAGTSIDMLLAYVKGQLLSDNGTLPTGQAYTAPGTKDWCALPKNVGGKAVSQLYIYKHGSDPVIGNKVKESAPGSEPVWIAPVLAASSMPTGEFSFHFKISDDSLNADAGTQKISTVLDQTNKYASTPTPNGQVIYQGTRAYTVKANQNTPELTAQVQGRDLYANAYQQLSSGGSQTPAKYFGSGLVASWAVSCPVLPPTRTPTPPSIDILSEFLEYCYGGGASNDQAFTLMRFAGYPFMFTTKVNGDPSIDTPWGKWDTRRYGGIFMFPPSVPVYFT